MVAISVEPHSAGMCTLRASLVFAFCLEEEIAAENQRAITVTSDKQLKLGDDFDAYIAIDGDGYRLVRLEARQ